MSRSTCSGRQASIEPQPQLTAHISELDPVAEPKLWSKVLLHNSLLKMLKMPTITPLSSHSDFFCCSTNCITFRLWTVLDFELLVVEWLMELEIEVGK